jgi:23S rRNA (pseudouridine1915-N3)-methyltransferase
LAKEADALWARVPPGWELMALDERGRQVDSDGFAGLLSGAEDRAVAGIVLAIGSDLGLDRNLRREARVELAVSRLTLPHQLARLLLWEQLFRATHILGGGGYHRRGVQ